MYSPPLLLALATVAAASTKVLTGGTIVAFDAATQGLRVIRNGHLVVVDGTITALGPGPWPATNATDETIDVTGHILTPGFIDTHRHGWQTALKTLASNTTLVEYFLRYSPFAAAPLYTPADVYLGQLAGLYENLHAGVTTVLDHAHCSWSDAHADAAIQASIDSRARVVYAYALQNMSATYGTADQMQHLQRLFAQDRVAGSNTQLGMAYDWFGPQLDVHEAMQVGLLARSLNVSVVTAHSVGGPWGFANAPSQLHRFGLLNTTIPVVLSHASFLPPDEARLLRAANQYISITPESEMHYGHGHPDSHLLSDQAALGVDTHMAFSADVLTQARLWLQVTRRRLYDAELARWSLSRTNPMSAEQALLLATRAGALALRRPDLGVLAVGATADIVVWDGDSPALLGWADPVAAVVLHASVGDIRHVLVGGEFAKRDGKLTAPGYADVKQRFLASARKLQAAFREMPYPKPEGDFPSSGYPYVDAQQIDILRGEGTGYGTYHV